MPDVKIPDNVSHPLADVIRERLGCAQSASLAVAFLRRSGLRMVGKPLARFLERGTHAECIFGFDYMFTEPEALTDLMDLSRSHPGLRFFGFLGQAGEEGIYHPKLYIFREDVLTHVIVGSSNLTRGGLRQNLEANVLLSGAPRDPPIVEAEHLYRDVRNDDSLFTPDAEYVVRYGELYKASRSARGTGASRAAIVRLRRELERRQEALPGTVPTQRQLIAEAIRTLRRDAQEFVHLRDIAAWVEDEARRRRLQFKWDTLRNSVRGRLNEHTVGKSGDDLFERQGGVGGRYGRYRLTEKGDLLRMRPTPVE
ncbi:MAG TPA: phospholipase D-like domain-containing protein [Armatimonadota bacterium]|nr:phospholipase D-like domain-containing protein [Armatimonadota bacterium]